MIFVSETKANTEEWTDDKCGRGVKCEDISGTRMYVVLL